MDSADQSVGLKAFDELEGDAGAIEQIEVESGGFGTATGSVFN